MKLYRVTLAGYQEVNIQAKNIIECMVIAKDISGKEFIKATILECEQPDKVGQTFYNPLSS